jgi:hypothetical protein
MHKKPLLIVGIDPGTTIGYAVLDTEGKIIKVSSSKQFNLNYLINKITDTGKVLVTGTDKKKIPDFVDKFSVKVGARIINPKHDLKISEKKDLTKEFKFNNEHERDALASALFAYQKIVPLFKKINIFIKKNQKEEYEHRLKELVLTNNINIKSALSIVEQPDKKEIKVIKKAIEKKQIKEEDFYKLYEKLKREEKVNELLKQQNTNLKNKINNLKQKYNYISKKINTLITEEKAQEILEQREERIFSLSKQLKIKQEEIHNLYNKINELNSFISNINNKVLLKKLRNLGFEEFERKNKTLNIQLNDILLVDNLNILSNRVIKYLRDKVNIIVYKGKINDKVKNELNVILIPASKLNISHNKYFAVIDKKEFETEKNNINLLKKIIDEYRKK